MNNKESIHVGISLADSELESYFFNKKDENLFIKIKAWNTKVIEFIFYDYIFFADNGGNFIMDFCLASSNNETLQRILRKQYQEIPENNPYKLFQFLDVDDDPYLEIICENFTFKLL